MYSGLAAFYPISDPFERAQLPQGEFDVPLMISDALFNADGSLAYNDNGDKGLWGDIILVNGVPWPTMKVKPRIYRFRVLVASISRSYRPTLSNGDPVYIVGTDAGMVPVVQAVPSWRQGTAERYEILDRLPQVQGRADRRPAQPEQQEQHRLRQHRQDHAVPGGGRLRPGVHHHRHPHQPGPRPACPTRPAAASTR